MTPSALVSMSDVVGFFFFKSIMEIYWNMLWVSVSQQTLINPSVGIFVSQSQENKTQEQMLADMFGQYIQNIYPHMAQSS